MELGMIGLGRMGANMVERLMKAGHSCVVYDSHADAVQQSVAKGAQGHNEPAGLRQGAVEAARRLADAAGGGGGFRAACAGAAARARRHRHRGRQFVLP